MTKVIEFNENKIKLYIRTISKEEEQWLITLLHMRIALDTATSSTTESPNDTPMSIAMELQKITQKSFEQYQNQQLLLPEPSQLSRILANRVDTATPFGDPKYITGVT